MTTKAKPTLPEPTKQALAKSTITPDKRFWDYMLSIQKQVADMDFGSKKGKGGSELKDSHALHHFIREIFIKDKVTFDLMPLDVTLTPTPIGTIAVYGNYLAKFYFDGELVYETPTFGAFDTGNSAQATHGAYTAARTSLLFNITQASVKSQEDMEKQRQNELNKQQQRKPAEPQSGVTYY